MMHTIATAITHVTTSTIGTVTIAMVAPSALPVPEMFEKNRNEEHP